jgi:hypothetical protein
MSAKRKGKPLGDRTVAMGHKLPARPRRCILTASPESRS